MNYYKFLIYPAVAMAALSMASCTDTLTEKPETAYDQATFFNSFDHAQMAIYGIYTAISDFNHYGLDQMAPPASDDTYLTSRTNNDNSIHDIVHYTANSTNTWIEALWRLKYQAVDRANTAVTGIEGMEQFASDSELRRLAGEARFLRAFMAFDLVTMWGDVPFSTKATQSYAEAFKPRTPREEIYDVMVQDLELAIEYLPWNAPDAPERPGRGAAEALLMRVLMQRAGYSLGLDGQMTRPDAASRRKYFSRVTELWQDLEQSGVHGFYDGGYDALFKGYSQGILNNRESLWEIAFYQEAGRRNGGAWGIYNGPSVAEPTGLPPTQLQAFMGRSNAFFIVVPEWLAFYEDSDVRRDINICQYRFTWDSEKHEHVKQNRNNTSWYVGKWRREWMPSNIWNKNVNYGDVNFCPLRYADMALLAAEAYTELGQTPEAWSLLNSVRRRAGATELSVSNYEKVMARIFRTHRPTFINDASEQGKLRMALYFERAFELCYEGQRKNDLIRWGILYDALKFFGERSALNDRSTKMYPAYLNFVPGKNELQPVPLKELQSNSKLNGVNNPGY